MVGAEQALLCRIEFLTDGTASRLLGVPPSNTSEPHLVRRHKEQ
jgi:hypothetical protein